MRVLYIDYTKGVEGNSQERFHGGGSFTRWIVNGLVANASQGLRIVLLVHEGYEAQSEEEVKLFANPKLELAHCRSINDFAYERNAKILIPLLPSRRLRILKSLKKNRPDLTVSIVIHGVRHIDLTPFDSYDKYYLNGILRVFPILYYLLKLLKAKVEKSSIRKYLGYADKVYAVSNKSLQEILKITPLQNVKLFNQQSNVIVRDVKIEFPHQYILFVSAARSEKNFIRTLVAFSEYKKHTNDDIYLYATGIDDDFLASLCKVKGVSKEVLDRWLVTYSYVSSQELSDLYHQSLFLLYTSKSEGYGIPLIEACQAGVPIVASNVTSIPEVLGAVVYYVNPYSVDSIRVGISEMLKPSALAQYKAWIQRRKAILSSQQELDQEVIISDIINF